MDYMNLLAAIRTGTAVSYNTIFWFSLIKELMSRRRCWLHFEKRINIYARWWQIVFADDLPKLPEAAKWWCNPPSVTRKICPRDTFPFQNRQHKSLLPLPYTGLIQSQSGMRQLPHDFRHQRCKFSPWRKFQCPFARKIRYAQTATDI